MNTITFDTGVLIALERRRDRAMRLLRLAIADRTRLVVPSVCVAEWWRARSDVRDQILASVSVVHTDDALMKVAGEALATVSSATTVDAVVMATAARVGDLVFTSDVDDLIRLQRAFPNVRVMAI